MCDCKTTNRETTVIPSYDYLQSVLLNFAPTANGVVNTAVTLDASYSQVVGIMLVPVSGSTVSDNMTVSVQADSDNYIAIQPLHLQTLTTAGKRNPLDAVIDVSKRPFKAQNETSTVFVKDYSGADNTLSLNVVFLLKK